VYLFLNDKSDVRSSYYLEDPATEFDNQGLELDWVGVCWDADLRWIDGRWSHHKFRGTRWQNVNDAFQRAYLSNAYRVLLTRARQGMGIYVPRGCGNDQTRICSYYDGTHALLASCGLDAMPNRDLKTSSQSSCLRSSRHVDMARLHEGLIRTAHPGVSCFRAELRGQYERE